MPDDATDETDETGPIAQPSWPSDPPPMANVSAEPVNMYETAVRTIYWVELA